MPGTGQRLDDALLAPTRVYVRAAAALWEAGVDSRGLVHISGGGLLNLARLAADVSYSLDELPPAPPVFALIAEAGRVPAAIDALRDAGEQPVRIGVVTDRPGRTVSLPTVGLTGRGEVFEPAS